MKKLYEKNELWFAILWIILYCAVTIPVRGSLGDESIVMTAVLALIAAGIFVFIKKYHLEEKYGLCKWKGNAGDYCFFIPMLILMTGNLWGGFGMSYSGAAQVFAIVSMLLIGFIEEMIFRGFLFRILLKKDSAPVAVIISAVTFGIGHIVNLLRDRRVLRQSFRYSSPSHGDLYLHLYFISQAACGYVLWFMGWLMCFQNLRLPMMR